MWVRAGGEWPTKVLQYKPTSQADLGERLGVDPQAVMALGDAENDLGMLELAGLAVAMGNAPPAVQAVAQYVTASNKEGDDGAARALERLFLGDARGDEAS